MGSLLVLMMVAVPTIHYRETYRFGKRLRTVAEGKLYRSGCLTADGFEEAIEKYHIKTIVNLQDEAPDPDLLNTYFSPHTTRESELCRAKGVKFIFLAVDLVNSRDFPEKHAGTVDSFLQIMDDPSNYPVLIHCKAGLHRTGCLAALYRREYENWSPQEALRELKNHGFGEFVSSDANPYIVQYITGYHPRHANSSGTVPTQGIPIQGVSIQHKAP
jgi:tyrosine-protein phosphatase SIW14